MGAEIIPFEFESNAVRTVLIEDRPWFVAADVCRVLEHSNPTVALNRLDDDEKKLIDPKLCLGSSVAGGGAQMMNVISESGLYALIMTSTKEAAKRFRKWVTAEVLPALRRHGRYEIAGAAMPESHQIGTARYIRLLEAERDDAQRAFRALARDYDQTLRIVEEMRRTDMVGWLRESKQAGTIRPKRISPVEEECISLLLSLGYTVPQISQVTGRNESSIRKRRDA